MARQRKLRSVENAGKTATVYRDPDTREFVVKLKGRPQADYFTDDRSDAEGTARRMVGLAGYGSPPETHRASAREASKAARWWLKEMRRQLSTIGSGRPASIACKSALDALTTANRMSAVTTSERRGAQPRGTSPVRAEQTRAQRRMIGFQGSTLRSAMERFARVCLIRR